jgi:type IV secretion system protein VirD4
MDMALHLARVQQRWRYADDDLAPGEGLSVEALAHDTTLLADNFEGPPDKSADSLLDFFTAGRSPAGAVADCGGSIEPASDHDGVLIAEGLTSETSVPEHALTSSSQP